MAWQEDGRESGSMSWPSTPFLHAVAKDVDTRDKPGHANPRAVVRQMLSHTLQKRVFRRLDRVGSSDMHPHALQSEAEQALLLIGAVEHFGQRELALGRV